MKGNLMIKKALVASVAIALAACGQAPQQQYTQAPAQYAVQPATQYVPVPVNNTYRRHDECDYFDSFGRYVDCNRGSRRNHTTVINKTYVTRPAAQPSSAAYQPSAYSKPVIKPSSPARTTSAPKLNIAKPPRPYKK